MSLAQPPRSRANSVRRLGPVLAVAMLFGGGACGADNVTKPEDRVDRVTMTSTKTNPHVGEETIVGATAVDAGGIQVLGVDCTLTADRPDLLEVTGGGGLWHGRGKAPGIVVLTATCAKRLNTVQITVQPLQVMLNVNKAGAGNGVVFVNPPGGVPNLVPVGATATLVASTFIGGTYDAGTTVVITATALAGSTFSTWGGACPAGDASSCTLTLKSDQTVTATFALGEPTRIIAVSGSLAFGSVKIGQSSSLTFTITNNGISTLKITGMTAPSGGAYTGSWTQGTIPAGASQPVTIIFTPPAAQSYNGTLTVNGDQTSGANTLAISGTGIGTGTGTATYDGTYDFLYRNSVPGGGTATNNSLRYIVIRNGSISSTDGAITSGTVDASGNVRFTSVCPISSNATATWVGTMNTPANVGANVGSGSYTCNPPIAGNSNTWQLTQSR